MEGERKDIECKRHGKYEVEVEGEDEDKLEALGEEQQEHDEDDQHEQRKEEVGEHMETGENHQREKAMSQDSEGQRTGHKPYVSNSRPVRKMWPGKSFYVARESDQGA